MHNGRITYKNWISESLFPKLLPGLANGKHQSEMRRKEDMKAGCAFLQLSPGIPPDAALSSRSVNYPTLVPARWGHGEGPLLPFSWFLYFLVRNLIKLSFC